MELMGTDLSDTVFIGDQLFTGCVWGKEDRNGEYPCETDPSERERFRLL